MVIQPEWGIPYNEYMYPDPWLYDHPKLWWYHPTYEQGTYGRMNMGALVCPIVS